MKTWRSVRNVCLAVVAVVVLAGCGLPGRPAVIIVAPAAGSQVTAGQPLTIQVSASDPQGVKRIEVMVDGTLIGTAQSPTAEGQASLDTANVWTFGQAGSHAVQAQAFNVAGQASDPAVVSVQVVAESASQPASTPTVAADAGAAQPPATPTWVAEVSTPEGAAPAGEAVVVRGCSLLTAAEAETILAEPAGPAQELDGGCAFNNASNSLYVASVGAAQGEKRADIAQGLLFVLGMAGLPLDEAHLGQFQALAEAQDYAGFFAEAVAAAEGVPAIQSRLLDGLGDVGYWAWIDAGERRQGALVVNRGETMVIVNLVVAEGRDEQALLEAAKVIAESVFARLPAVFVMETPAQE